MTLPRVPATAVAAGTALDRASSGDELDAIWLANNCDRFRGAAAHYVRSIYKGVIARLDRNAKALEMARAS